jgi:antitoxin component YwqK of YwqJK toxin-antitoxin module
MNTVSRIWSPERISYYEDGKEEGEWKEFYENGQLIKIKYYKDGKEDIKSQTQNSKHLTS